MNARRRGLDALASSTSRVLVLGSFPGERSLCLGEYYANERNVFWKLMGELFGASPSLPYEKRTEILLKRGIALWDVIESCERIGSTDGRIVATSIVTNDIDSFLVEHPEIRRVYLNGAMAERCFRRRVVLQSRPEPLTIQRLPSTSPANATATYANKLVAWRVVE